MIGYINDPKNSTMEILQLINTFSNVKGYKINSRKSVALLYTDDKRAGEEIKESTSFTIAISNKISRSNSNQTSGRLVCQEL